MNSNSKYRKIIFYKSYFSDFFIKQPEKVRNKIIWTFELIEDIQKIPETYLKHIKNTKGLFEIRIQCSNNIFRVFCFFDKGDLIILANAFQKKTSKTPRKEINKALKIMKEYYNEK